MAMVNMIVAGLLLAGCSSSVTGELPPLAQERPAGMTPEQAKAAAEALERAIAERQRTDVAAIEGR